MKKIWTEVLIAVALLPVCAAVASADPEPSCPHHGPPPEAFTACASATQGDACTVSFGGHDMSGTCEPFADGGLACRPDHPPPPPSGG